MNENIAEEVQNMTDEEAIQHRDKRHVELRWRMDKTLSKAAKKMQRTFDDWKTTEFFEIWSRCVQRAFRESNGISSKDPEARHYKGEEPLPLSQTRSNATFQTMMRT